MSFVPSTVAFTGAAAGIGVLAHCMNQDNSSKTVCVTGGSGFLGSWCVKLLLERGHTVHATTRRPAKAEFLKDLPFADERLTIFAGCDFFKEGSFDAAIEGCDVVLHTASPFFVKGGTEDNLVKPAVQGIQNVYNSCVKFNIPEIVSTSSTVSVYANYGSMPEDHLYTEENWSPVEIMRDHENWYCLSKTLAEQEAWKYAEEHGFNLAVMNPCLILGPQLPGQKHLNTSTASLTAYCDGSKPEIENGRKNVVDVRDVALAHILAFEKGTNWGSRCLLVGGWPHWSEICDAIREMEDIDNSKVPTAVTTEPKLPAMGCAVATFDTTVSTSRLGLQYTSVKDMVQGNVKSSIDNGFVSTAQYAPGQ